jgi:hypothetical protein
MVDDVLALLRQAGLIRELDLRRVGRDFVTVLDVRRGTARADLVEAIRAVCPSLSKKALDLVRRSVSEAADGRLLFRVSHNRHSTELRPNLRIASARSRDTKFDRVLA